ncbi:DUF3370 domain-containing protein [Geminocystis sp. NIES-3709]|uniref:DUF3370 domain-containing protein n=1 Tax=Geminocystis sp. NIES-3709 TaxID=1617448 RepID=UPI0005FC959E|nr:DUF3370 domain-containing protein [Geminocystis sp. NIES-3709]BAQ65636.1 hypothetical protein GM3709_2401 [Geminocystis sp. NIES-3709]
MLELLPLFLPINPSIIYSQNPQNSEIVTENQTVRPLSGQLNKISVFNSNSPELVLGEGILLSTFPQDNKTDATAHLNFPFEGRFDIFAHHVSKPPTEDDQRTLYLGIIVHNPSQESISIDILEGASYLSQPDAPFITLPSQVEGSNIYAGPGSRVMGEILQGKRQEIFPPNVIIPAGESRMLLNAPIPIHSLTPPINGRSTYLRLYSSGKVYVASLAMYQDEDNKPPSLSQWQNLLQNASLSTPRDKTPTPPEAQGQRIYGRVAGVSQGNMWKTDLTDSPSTQLLTIPNSGEAFSYGLSTLIGGTLGTNQIQTAPLLVRYPDTAYSAHGNYGLQYSLTLPLFNPSNETKTVNIAISTPVKQDTPGVNFLNHLPTQTFFRGLVQVKYNDDNNIPRLQYFHLVQKRGEKGENLVTLTMPPQTQKLVSVDFLYPPDATPPQILTVSTDGN